MADESVQQKLSRVRPPRVHITYNVEIGDAIETKELPFVLGVLGDFKGYADLDKPLADRKFIEVTPDKFDEVLKEMKPRITLRVSNKLQDSPNAPQLNLEISCEKLEHFDPYEVLQRAVIPGVDPEEKGSHPLKELFKLRTRLSDLRGSLQGNTNLDNLLREMAKSATERKQVMDEIAANSEERERQRKVKEQEAKEQEAREREAKERRAEEREAKAREKDAKGAKERGTSEQGGNEGGEHA